MARKRIDAPKTRGRMESARPRKTMEQPRNRSFESRQVSASPARRIETSQPRRNVSEVKRAETKDIYSRPAWRAGVKEQVWEQAKDTHGRVRDPLTGKYMSKNQPWDVGHKPGHEFKKHQESAAERGISRQQFIEEYNNPANLQPELPSSNRSHKGENKTDTYFGP